MAEKNIRELKGELLELKEKEKNLREVFKKLVNTTANLVLEMIRVPVEDCDTQNLQENARKLHTLRREVLSVSARIKEIEKLLGSEQ